MHNTLDDAQKATELQLSMLVAKPQPLSPLVQETFEKTFQNLAARIDKASDSKACELVDKLIQIAHVKTYLSSGRIQVTLTRYSYQQEIYLRCMLHEQA